MKTFKLIAVVILLSVIFGYHLSQGVAEDYSAEIESQVKQTRARYANSMSLEYFHDMGIIARKADEAELTDLTARILREYLIKPMSDYVEQEIAQINELYLSDAYKASERMSVLNHFVRYYQPTQEFLNTAAGKALAGEFILMQKSTLDGLSAACDDLSLQQGLKTILMTGLFQTNSTQEINNLRGLTREVECCLSWKTAIHYEYSQPFETDYEQGSLTETANLKLQSNPKNLSEARWSGDWIYKFKGREGTGEGLSQAILTYKRGSETADLVITASKVTSAGRMNFPRSLAGEPRTVLLKGKPLLPAIVMSGQQMDLNGCKNKG